MFERLRFLRSAQQAETASKDDDLKLFPGDSHKRVLLVTLVGVKPEYQPEIIDVISRRFARHDKIVYITDDPDFRNFRQAGAIFEYIPSPEKQDRHRQAMNWADYLTTRWELLQTKWRPEKILSYGTNMENMLASIKNRQSGAGR